MYIPIVDGFLSVLDIALPKPIHITPYRAQCAPSSSGNQPPLAGHGLAINGIPYCASVSTLTPRTKDRLHTVMLHRATKKHSALHNARRQASASGAPPRDGCSRDNNGTPRSTPKRQRCSRRHLLTLGDDRGALARRDKDNGRCRRDCAYLTRRRRSQLTR